MARESQQLVIRLTPGSIESHAGHIPTHPVAPAMRSSGRQSGFQTCPLTRAILAHTFRLSHPLRTVLDDDRHTDSHS
jgi:hypothetical protein